MTVEGKPQSTPTPTSLRVVGGIVFLATILLTILFILFVKSPLRPVPREMEGLFVQSLVTCLVLSPGGGLYMFSKTRNPWWFLTIIPFVGVVVVWWLISLMDPVLFH